MSEPAVLVVAGVILSDPLVNKRKYIHTRNAEVGKEVAVAGTRELTVRHWQLRWDIETREKWTAGLITNLAEWTERGYGEVNYCLTRLLTGHGLSLIHI